MAIKLKTRTKFPALVQVTAPLTLVKTGFLYVFGIDVTGLLASIVVSFANISGNISVTQMNGGTGAAANTFWRGDGTWAAANSQADRIFKYQNFS